jgi:hypothetical protein
MTKTRKLKRNWSVCDLKILIWLICKHCDREGYTIADIHNVNESWELISSLIPGTTAESCLFKWLSLKRHKITLHGWLEQEEKILIDLEKYPSFHSGNTQSHATNGSSYRKSSTP